MLLYDPQAASYVRMPESPALAGRLLSTEDASRHRSLVNFMSEPGYPKGVLFGGQHPEQPPIASLVTPSTTSPFRVIGQPVTTSHPECWCINVLRASLALNSMLFDISGIESSLPITPPTVRSHPITMVLPHIHLELPEFTVSSIEEHLRQLNASPPKSLLPAAEITGTVRTAARDSVKRDSQLSAETVTDDPLSTISRQGLRWSYANYARDSEQEQLADDDRIKRIIRATAGICTYRRGHNFTPDFNITLALGGTATDEESGESDAESLPKLLPTPPASGSPRLHRTTASRELRKLAGLSPKDAKYQDMDFACGLKGKLFHGRRKAPNISTDTPGHEPQGPGIVSIPSKP